MNWRHECKCEVNRADLAALRMRMQAVMQSDSHAVNGKYAIRSLYFDSASDKALREKLDGVNMREKFRIRYYNDDTGVIFLEKKSKYNNLCNKQSVALDISMVRAILRGDLTWMANHPDGLVREFYVKIKNDGLRPKTIVDYTREPFVYSPGNVRVTLDYDIRTGIGCTDFLNRDCITVPAGNPYIILEIKWDSFLPDIIRDTVRIPARRCGSFSKYAQCRIYG